MLQFLSCLESSFESNGGKFDPPLSSVEEETKKLPQQVASADPQKAKRRFPWTKKEVQSEENLAIPTSDSEKVKVDWVFKLTIIAKPDHHQENQEDGKSNLLVPKSKLSGSREWLTNLFSPNKSRNAGSSSTNGSR